MVYLVDIDKHLLYWLKVNQSVQQVLNKWIKENFRKRIVSVKFDAYYRSCKTG